MNPVNARVCGKSSQPTDLLTRRRILKATGALAAATFAGPFIRGQDKSDKKPIIVGSGAHQFEVQHDWGQLPTRIKYGNTHGVCEDSQGNIYIHHTVGAGSESDDTLVVFDADGKFVRSWGKEFKGSAHGLHIVKEGGAEFLYFCDNGRGVAQKRDLKGEVVWTKKAPMESGVYGDAGEFHPTNIAIAPNGDFFVSDGYGKSWIHRYNAKAEYVGTFGGPGKERGQMSCPHGLMVDTRGKQPELVVADRSNRRLQYFSLDGRHLRFVTDELRSPCHFHEREGVLLVPDLEARVTLFDRENKLIAHLGDGQNYALRDKPREQFVAGQFIAPHSAIFDHSGNIFVVEWVEVGRVTKLKKLA